MSEVRGMKRFTALLFTLIFCTSLCFTAFADGGQYAVSPLDALSEQRFRLMLALRTSAYIPVSGIMQEPELPNGCEVTSLAMVLNYYGYDVDKVDLYDNYLQHEALELTDDDVYIGCDPNLVYVGDARSATMGFYCFSAPITKAANLYLTLNGMRASASNVSGADADELEHMLEHGQPVIVWATIAFEPLRVGQLFTWELATGEIYHPYANLHCVVLKGYDTENYYFSDPLYGEQIVEKAVFLEQYEALGSQAVVLNAPRGDLPLAKKSKAKTVVF